MAYTGESRHPGTPELKADIRPARRHGAGIMAFPVITRHLSGCPPLPSSFNVLARELRVKQTWGRNQRHLKDQKFMSWIKNSNLVYNQQNITYDVYQQDLPNNCSVACMIMLVKHVLNKNLAPGTVQLWIRQTQHMNANGFAAPDNAWRWGGVRGASIPDIFATLQRHLPQHQHRWYRVMPGLGSQVIPIQLGICTPQRPAIVLISWNHGGSRHVALCLGKRPSRPEIVFLDPLYGVVACPYINYGNMLDYDTQQNSFGKHRFRGTIDEALFS